ncbi:CLUMA_CG015227, isoform A [Clunio marinus]|uniref:CLUMA_CG015227, isoform A n=1 Tax=Clunio marinus TaxID=568069 RepID=A0A1J1IS89_9DIPT|nr:CLUMA_CG015227, isoform A [Clunio marinus]
MAMEKFIFTFKLSKGSIIIGWTKLVIASLISTTLFLGVIFSSALRDSLKKIFTSDGNDSSFTTSFCCFYFSSHMLSLLSLWLLEVSIVFSYWKQLHKEHEIRIENQEHRKRSQQNNRKEPVAIAPSTGTESEIITANV